jgi:hypothetical protein
LRAAQRLSAESALSLLTDVHMSSHNKRPLEDGPTGPEGVPVDAPGNDAPALSPHAVSRTHRAENDATAISRSPDFTDDRGGADNRHVQQREPADRYATRHDEPAEGLKTDKPSPREPNPGHHVAKDDHAAPRGRGDGELMEQPGSTSEARQPGPDSRE